MISITDIDLSPKEKKCLLMCLEEVDRKETETLRRMVIQALENNKHQELTPEKVWQILQSVLDYKYEYDELKEYSFDDGNSLNEFDNLSNDVIAKLEKAIANEIKINNLPAIATPYLELKDILKIELAEFEDPYDSIHVYVLIQEDETKKQDPYYLRIEKDKWLQILNETIIKMHHLSCILSVLADYELIAFYCEVISDFDYINSFHIEKYPVYDVVDFHIRIYDPL